MRCRYPVLSLISLFALTALPLSAAIPQPVYDKETVALWWLAEDNGRTVRQDAPGAPELASRPGALIEFNEGVKAMRFPGGLRLSTRGPQHALALDQAVTLEVWLKIDELAPNDKVMGVFQHISWPQGGFRMRIRPDGRLEWIVLNGRTQRIALTRLELPRERWLHLAGTYDGKQMAVYVDGELERIMSVDDGVVRPLGQPYTLIGFTDPRDYFTGWIHAVRVSKTVRSFP